MIEDILPRLEKVRKTGPNNWLACCPAHDDRNPSLSLHAAQDGRILATCFPGCSFPEIVEAVGLGWEPWFPPKSDQDRLPRVRAAYPAADVLVALAEEARLVAVAACNLGNGFDLTNEDKERLLVAQARIEEARRLSIGIR